MLSPGNRFCLTQTTTGIQLLNGTATVVSVPAGEIITMLSGPNENGMLRDKGLVYTLWEERTVALFAVDVAARGIEIKHSDDGYQPNMRAKA